MIDNRVLEHVDIKRNVEATCAHRCELAKHDVLCYPMTIILFTDCRRFHQNFHRFLERAPHQRASISTVDTMSSDRHECAAVRHEVAEEG